MLVDQETSMSMSALFGAFISVLTLAGLFINCLLSEKARRWFWNNFLLMQLLPRDDLDKEFMKNLNDFIRAA